MNQILYVKEDNKNSNSNKKKRKIFKGQFVFSIFFLLIFIALFITFRYNNQTSSNDYASRLNNNYQIYRLYADNSQTNNAVSSSIIGTIEIPKINISYPILSELNETLLKVSPCRFLGDISDNSNLCIAGHNYDNDKFFSRIWSLNNGDKVIISDNDNYTYNFSVFNKYEVDSSDLSPIYEVTNKYKKELTLVTCNNQNNKRIIVKAKLD